jgi:hypothetical protein
MANKKNIKNYTSETPASTSINRIEEMIVAAGAQQVSKTYSDGELTGLKFVLPVNNMLLTFLIDPRVDFVYKKMIAAYVKTPTSAQRDACYRQANRTAWKNQQELLQIQLDMVELDQVDMMQALFLSLTDGKETVYEKIKKTGYKALLPPATS